MTFAPEEPPLNILTLPDTLAGWPWKRSINPLYEEAKANSSAWVRSLNTLSPRAQKAIEISDPNLLAALAYSFDTKDILSVGCDLMNLIFLCDEYTDFAAEEDVQRLADMVVDAMRNPFTPRPPGENPIGETARQFFLRLRKSTSDSVGKRLIDVYDEYLSSLITEARDRSTGTQRLINNVEQYLDTRRINIAVKPSYVIMHSPLNLPDEFYNDPVVQKLTQDSITMVIVCNDIYSYNVEQSRGDGGNNLVTIVMRQENIGVEGALEWIGQYISKLKQEFLNNTTRVPSFGVQHEDAVRRYIDSLGNTVTANDTWSFETGRYFGTSGLEIQRSRKVALLPVVKRASELVKAS